MRQVPRFAVCAVALVVLAARAHGQERVEWHGYAQLRAYDATSDAGFTVRRAKLWIVGPAPGLDGLRFRVQGIFQSRVSGALVLQDAFVEYRWVLGALRAGQMVPDFSLERIQPDAELPVIERAIVVNTLVPAATTMARDIGAQVTLGPAGGRWHASVGLFNGSGANRLTNDGKRLLATGRATYTISLAPRVGWELGAFAAWREARKLDVGAILPSGQRFSGTDRRWGAESRLSGSGWEVQGEYIRTMLEGTTAWGWYGFATCTVTEKDQVLASAERLHVPNPDHADDPWYILGYSHFFAGHKVKAMLDTRVQFAGAQTNYSATAQWQVFFH